LEKESADRKEFYPNISFLAILILLSSFFILLFILSLSIIPLHYMYQILSIFYFTFIFFFLPLLSDVYKKWSVPLLLWKRINRHNL